MWLSVLVQEAHLHQSVRGSGCGLYVFPIKQRCGFSLSQSYNRCGIYVPVSPSKGGVAYVPVSPSERGVAYIPVSLGEEVWPMYLSALGRRRGICTCQP